MHIVSRQPSERTPVARAPARMAPLAVLPIFLALKGKRAIVAGGTEAAAWKAELLAAAGVCVHVYVPHGDLARGFAARIEEGGGHGYVHHDRPWGADIFAGCAVAVIDAASDAEAEAFSRAAQTAGVPVNVIDRPAFCQFSFGTIVNRSPVVVGISTDGAAPVLGQALRRKIETLLPASLADWAALAQAMRATVAERLRPGRGRRDFWERFTDRAFGPAPRADDAEALIAAIDQIAANADIGRGRVTLVGAGPGDPELLTLKAVRALQGADVILFDDLVSDEVLELARREAKRILVGKRGGRDSCRQDDINDLMVRLAGAGRRVVRLKSGDPTLFGRAGEEIAQLQAAGIPVDIVPGITAGIAMAAALGISLTHRDHAKSVRFVTGHSRHGGLPEDVDWRAIADPSATTIFYMSGRTAGEIADRLVVLGLSADTPAAVASALSRPEQTLVSTRLKDLAAVVAAIGLAQPVAIGIGQAFGATGALTRSEEHPSQVAAARSA